MASDGVSLPTTIAQLGSVAKTQVKGTQTAQPTAPFADQLDKRDELKVQRVKDLAKTENQTIKPDQEKGQDKRRQRRHRRNRNLLAQSEDESEGQDSSPDELEEENRERVGILIDLLA